MLTGTARPNWSHGQRDVRTVPGGEGDVLIGPNLMSGSREEAVAEALSVADDKGIPVVYVRDET